MVGDPANHEYLVVLCHLHLPHTTFTQYSIPIFKQHTKINKDVGHLSCNIASMPSETSLAYLLLIRLFYSI